jgi:large subunit ribosomal protein L3
MDLPIIIMPGIIAKKVGMSRIFLEDGRAVPVTYLKVEPNTVVRLKQEAKDGYNAAVLAIGAKEWKSRKGKDNVKYAVQKEWRLEAGEELKAGEFVTCETFPLNSLVTVTGISKGKGFQGPIKRHNFARGPMSHGSHHKREGGSIGMSNFPGRVLKGKRMAGRMGNDKVTVKKREILYCNPTEQLLAVKGPVPGACGTAVFLTLEPNA